MQKWTPVTTNYSSIFESDITDMPLMKMSARKVSQHSFNSPEPKNKFFEFATVFDDKLQQIFAFFQSFELFSNKNPRHPAQAVNHSVNKKANNTGCQT